MIAQKMPQDAVIDIVKVEYLPPYTLHLWFSDGAEQTVNFEPFLRHAAHPDIQKYLDVELFKQFKLVHGRLDWNDYELCFPIQDLYEGTLLKSSISNAQSYEEMAEFWDTHSVADYEDQIEEVEMSFEPSALHNQIAVRTQEAKRNYDMGNVQHGTVEDFMNSLEETEKESSEANAH